MRIIRGLHNLNSQFVAGCVATIGNYDGVHLGHQQILNIVKQKAGELKLPAVVVIFEPQPEEFFAKDQLVRLTIFREKILLLEQYGIDNVVLLPFNSCIAGITASRFIVEILVGLLHVKYLVVGDDFEFGYRRAGGFSLLEHEALRGDFQAVKIPSFRVEGVRVSSSLIRTALLQGNLKIAAEFLGRQYRVSGKVVQGDHRGRELGFPTANVYLKRRELPITGVYVVKVSGLTASPLLGIANVGVRPTVAGKYKLLEVHILDFNANIYGKGISVEFWQKLRDEHKFVSLVKLQLQLKKDVEGARKNHDNLYR